MDDFLNNDLFITFRRGARYVPFLRDVVALYFCMVDRQTPLWARGAIASALAYFLNAFDLIADYIPITGFADDAGVIAATVTAIASLMTETHRQQAEAWLSAEPPTATDDRPPSEIPPM
jgi:uncharacterized membrane protein YkvA (DUF1232 family)